MPSPPYTVPFASRERFEPGGNIAQLILAAGQARAQGAQRSGEIWGGTLRDIGSGIGDYLQRQQQMKRQEALDAPRIELQNEQLMAIRSERQRKEALQKAYAGLDPSDPQSLTNLAKQYPEAAESIMQTGGQIMKSFDEAATRKTAAEEAAQYALARAGQALIDAHASGDPNLIGASLRIVHEKAKAFYPKEADAIVQQLMDDPDKIPQVGGMLVKQSPRWQNEQLAAKKAGLMSVGAGGVMDVNTGKEVVGPKPTTETEWVTRGGQPVEIRKGTSVAGDKPYHAPPDPGAGIARTDARVDRSYQFHAREIDAVSKPLMDKAERFDRLQESIDAKSPQADALIAPELLTVMAGGAGSGLRMNEAEISRILRGRSTIEDFKATLNKLSLDPRAALSIPDDQREQIRDLTKAVRERLDERVSMVSKARRRLAASEDIAEHKNILADLQEQLSRTTKKETPTKVLPDDPSQWK